MATNRREIRRTRELGAKAIAPYYVISRHGGVGKGVGKVLGEVTHGDANAGGIIMSNIQWLLTVNFLGGDSAEIASLLRLSSAAQFPDCSSRLVK